MTALQRYGLYILLDEAAERLLRRWAEQMPGASWPSWGGHITLLPHVPAEVDFREIDARVQAVVERHTAFDCRMDQVVTDQDLTRSDYNTVFLTVGDPADPAGAALRALQADLTAAMADLTHPGPDVLEPEQFVPHITLALSVSQREAERMVSRIRSDGLAVEFRVDAVWVLGFSLGTPPEIVQRDRYPLDGMQPRMPSASIVPA